MILQSDHDELRRMVMSGHSRLNRDRIADWVGQDPQKAAQLIHLFKHDEYRVVQRLAWSISSIAEKAPALLEPYIPELVARLKSPDIHDAVKRNIMRVLEFLPLPETEHGEIMHRAFGYLHDPGEPVAVKAFSMSVLARLAVIYPDIRRELVLAIGELLEKEPSPGIVSRAKKVLKQLKTGRFT